MEVRGAAASGGGILVDGHFGRASRFLIYRLSDGVWEHVENRINAPAYVNKTRLPFSAKKEAMLSYSLRPS